MYELKLYCPYEVYDNEKIELQIGLYEFLNDFMGGKYDNFRIGSMTHDTVLAEVLELETEDFHTEEDWVRREDVLKLLSKHFA